MALMWAPLIGSPASFARRQDGLRRDGWVIVSGARSAGLLEAVRGF